MPGDVHGQVMEELRNDFKKNFGNYFRINSTID
jgi:hypothetical protein